MDYYNEIKNKLIDNEIYGAVKDYSKNRHDLETRYEVGRILSEAGKHYGENIIGEYAKKLTVEVNKKYGVTNLKRMRQFYAMIQKGALMAHQLSYSHYVELLPIKDNNKLKYYLDIVIKQKLTRDELRKRIKSHEYERLDEETKTKLIRKEDVSIKDMVPNPIIISNPNNVEVIKEKVLKDLIIDDIESFIKQLGNGYSFIGSEYRIKIGDRYNYIDILLFNIEYNCYVVVELKITEVKKEHIGQIEVYMNYIDKNIKKIYHDKTIGIILCKEDNHYIIDYSSDSRIIARKYILI